jgi:hypothetical protein
VKQSLSWGLQTFWLPSNKRRELGKELKFIQTKPGNCDTSFGAHRNMCTETLSETIFQFNPEICSKQTVDTRNPPDIVYVCSHYAFMQFQTATAYVGTALSELLSDWRELSKCQYRVWWTVKCENTKFLTQFGRMKFLNFERLVTSSVVWNIFFF